MMAARLRSPQSQYAWLVFLAILTGVLGAAGNIVFTVAIEAASTSAEAAREAIGALLPARLGGLAVPLVLVGAGLVLYALENLFPGEVLGYGFPRFLEMLHLQGGRVRRRWMVFKTISAAISLGAGASVGREGPIAQVGGSIASAIGQLARLSGQRLKVLIACGSAAAIATTFNAPIGGVLFAQEIILQGDIQLANFSLAVVASATAVVTSRAYLGDESVFHVQPFIMRSYWELLIYGAMGIFLGLLAVFYIRLFHAASAFLGRFRAGVLGRLLLGLFLVGIIAMALPRNLSDGYSTINDALGGRLPWKLMGALALAKIAASSLSLGCGAPGGVFGPVFFIGAMTGGTFRRLSEVLFPGLTAPPGSYALIGLGAFLAATTHAPLTAIFLLFEMTDNYETTIPAMVATTLGVIVASLIERESIDTLVLAREGKILRRTPEEALLDGIKVESVMRRDFHVLRENATLPEVLHTVSDAAESTFPVVNAQGRMVGVLSVKDARRAFLETGLGPLVVARDLCTENVPTVTPDTTLARALGRMESDGLEEIPVVSPCEEGKVIGLLSRADLVRALNRSLLAFHVLPGLEPSAHPATTAAWSQNCLVTTVEIPSSLAGKTLRDLDWRARFGVNVIALRPRGAAEDKLDVPEPDRPLETGDAVVIVGPRDKVEALASAGGKEIQ